MYSNKLYIWLLYFKYNVSSNALITVIFVFELKTFNFLLL